MPLSSFYQISFCPLGRSSDPIPCIVGSHPVWGDRCRCCCCYSTSSHPSPLLPLHQRTAATVCWLNSREATILQPRQSRLHRWVTIKHESDYSCLWNCFFFFFCEGEWEAQTFEIMWSCFLDYFLCLFVSSGVAHVCIFSSQACNTLKHIYTRTNRDARGLRRNLKGFDQSCSVFCLCFLSLLHSLILAPGVIYSTV